MFDAIPPDDETNDPNSRESLRFLNWRPSKPDRDIPCTCGATVHLRGNRNRCGCGAVWNAYGQQIAAGRQP